jgi:hypothetical protein
MAYTTASLGPHQGPMAIDDIINEADQLLEDYTPVIPLKFWLRSADTIQKQVPSQRHRHRLHVLIVLLTANTHLRLSHMSAMVITRKLSSSITAMPCLL